MNTSSKKNLVEVWAGDFTFLENPNRAIINELHKVIEVEEDRLDFECEHIITTYDSYLVPSEYKGDIIKDGQKI